MIIAANAKARVTMGNRQRNSTSIRAFAHTVVAEFDRLFNSADRESSSRQPTVHQHPQHALAALARWLKPENRCLAPFTASPK